MWAMYWSITRGSDSSHFQMSQSNESQVALKNVGFGLAGNFSCEVTADAPLFSTKTAYNQMRVVGKKTIWDLSWIY